MGCTFVRFTPQEICDLEELVHRSGEPVVVKGVIKGLFDHASDPLRKT
jgi:hypothetical protein